MYHSTFIIKYRTLSRLFDAIEMVNNDFIYMILLKYWCDNTCYPFPKGVLLAGVQGEAFHQMLGGTEICLDLLFSRSVIDPALCLK